MQLNNKTVHAIAVLFILILLSNCAQVLIPSGGPRDTQPPYVIKYLPDSAATEVKANEFNLHFNEYIVLKDVQSQLIISPPLELQPEVTLVKNKILNIKLNSQLKDNTTYTFDFGKSIADFTEGNTATNFIYVFSTGKLIDTLQLKGSVINAFNLKPEADIVVALYENFKDSSVYKRLPQYFAKTDAKGNYRIKNIKAGTYSLAAFKDEIKNYKYNPYSEYFGFTDSPVELKKNSTSDLVLFKEDATGNGIKKIIPEEYGSFLITFFKPIKEIKTVGIKNTNTKSFIYEYQSGADNVTIWVPDFTQDSLNFLIYDGDQLLDTVKICGCSLVKKRINRATTITFTTNIPVAGLFDQQPQNVIKIIASQPIKNINKLEETIQLFSKEKTIKKIITVDSNRRTILLKFDPAKHGNEHRLISDSTYTLFIKQGILKDIFGFTNDSLKVKFKVQDEKYYGTLKFKLKVSRQGYYIFQLLNEKQEVIKQKNFSSSETFDFSFLSPGNYSVKIIEDKNINGEWDTGNFSEKRQPEKVLFYSKPVVIRSNWDAEVEWEMPEFK